MGLDEELHAIIALTDDPVTVDEAARTLGVDPAEILDAGERLERQGAIRESGAGWVAVTEPDVSGPRRALLAGRLVEVIGDDRPARRGRLLLIAGRGDVALPMLTAAGEGGDPEAASLALEAGPPADPQAAGRLHLVLAGHHRSRGDSDIALGHASRAVPLLDPSAAADAIGFIAQLHDDLQHPQEAATWATLAAGLARNHDLPAKEGSLLTLAARSLSRLGFAEEAEAAATKGNQLVEAHGDPTQRARARINKGWVLLDHGDADDAAATFASVADLAEYLGGDAAQASRYANEARALFHTSRSAEAIDAYQSAMDLAGDASAPRFLAHLAFAEGATLHGLGEGAVDAAEEAHAVAMATMPAWQNVTHLTLARAHRVNGDAATAAEHLARAMELTDPGIDGLRVRLRCDVERLAQLEGGPWPRDEAARLTDLLLQGRWYATAVELMTLRAAHEKGFDLGAQAVALAARLGSPLLAARAADTAGLWAKPEGAAAATLVRQADEHVAEPWRSHWEALPAVAAAKAVDVDTDAELDASALEGALLRAGLDPETPTLSPAQRSSAGMEFRARRTARGWVPIALAGAAVVVAIAALAATLWPEAEAPPTTVAGPTTTTTTTIPVPDPWAGGFHAHRGDAGGTGLSDGGITGPEGLYWRATPSGEAQVGAIAAGTRLFVASSTRDEVTQIDQPSGSISWQESVSDRLLVPLSVGQLDVEGAPTYYVVWVASDGVVGAFDQTGASVWRTVPADLPGVTRAAPVLDGGVVYLSRTADDGSGYVAALDLASGSVLWRTDELGVEMGAVEASVSIGDGTVYVAPQGNRLHLLEVDTGAERCNLIQGNGERPSRPVVADGFVAVAADGGGIGIYDGSCNDMASFSVRWETDTGTDVASADGVLYFVSEGGLLAIDPALADSSGDLVNPPERMWPVVNPTAEGDGWVTSPVVTGDQVLVGSEQGEVAAIDRATGEKVWSYDVGAEIVDDELTPVKGAIYVVTVDGEVLAVGGPRLDG